MPMTNKQLAEYFASLPPTEPGMILMINGMNSCAQSFFIDEPGTNLDEIADPEQLSEGDDKLITMLYE